MHFDHKIDKLQQSVQEAEENRKKEANETNKKIDLLRTQQTLTDDFEVLILGLPIAFSKSYEEATRMLYTALGLSQNKIPLFDFREWTSARPAANAPYPTKGYVIEMPTAKSRTNLLNMGPMLKNLHSNDIWKMGDAHNVSIRPLWPTTVHQLQGAATRSSKELNFARPLVRGLVVCMRQIRNSTPIPIYSMEELDALVSRFKPPPFLSPTSQMQIP